MTVFQIDKQIDLLEVNIKALHRRIESYQHEITRLREQRRAKIESEELIATIETHSMSAAELKEFLSKQTGALGLPSKA